jgi:hypothetical protein
MSKGMEPAYWSSRDSQYWPEFSVKMKAMRYVPKQMIPVLREGAELWLQG